MRLLIVTSVVIAWRSVGWDDLVIVDRAERASNWIVVSAAFGVQVLVFGILYGFGVVLDSVETDLATSKANVALIPAVAAFVLFMVGPLTGRLLTEADRRGLTPLFWTHVAPYGEVRLNMQRRLDL